MQVLMVCLGNICRSPTAEAVLRAKLAAAGLADRVMVDSAGTGDWHVGAPPDGRAIEHAARRGYELAALRGRQVAAADFERFDLIFAMDEANLSDLQAACPRAHRSKLRLLMDCAGSDAGRVVPDPYTRGPEAFERVLDLVERACDGLVTELSAKNLRNFRAET